MQGTDHARDPGKNVDFFSDSGNGEINSLNKCESKGSKPLHTEYYSELKKYGDSNLLDELKSEGFDILQPEDYLELDIYGNGSFGITKKCLHNKTKEFHAIKFFKPSEKESFFQELKIYEEITKIKKNVECSKIERNSQDREIKIASLIDKGYTLNTNDQIESLALILEAGDFSLKELIEKRKEINEKKTIWHSFWHFGSRYDVYHPMDVKNLFFSFIPTFRFLEQNNIYHGDIKPGNIVFSKENGYFLIDFGMGKMVKKDDIEASKVYKEGTKGFNSPEKKDWLEFRINVPVNPYKCDIFSFGVCLEKMLGNSKIIENHYDIQRIITCLKKSKIEERYDFKNMEDETYKIKLDSMEPKYFKFWEPTIPYKDPFKIEKQYWEALSRERLKKQDLLEKYKNVELPFEKLKNCLLLIDDENQDISESTWKKYDEKMIILGDN